MHTSAPRRAGAAWCPGRPAACPACGPRPGSPPGTATRPATRRTATSSAPPSRRTAGPSPQSNCSHSPGSGIHGRYVAGARPPRAPSPSATARRVVRSSPANPTATSRSCTMSARTSPFERSTQLLDLRQERVDQLGRGGPGRGPAARRSRRRHPVRTVFGSHPASCAAECAHPVRSNASKNFHDLPVILLHGPSTGSGPTAPRAHRWRDHHEGPTRRRPGTAPAGRSAVRRRGDAVSAYREIGVSAVSRDCGRVDHG